MIHRKIPLLLILFLFLLRSGYAASIAESCPNDDPRCLAANSKVLLFENFESYSQGLTGTALNTAIIAGTNPTGKTVAPTKQPYGTWTKAGHPDYASIVDAAHGKVFQGSLAYQAKLPVGTTLQQTWITQQTLYHPKVHIRWYQMWASNYLVASSNHNGGALAGGTIKGIPGRVPAADGSGWFSFHLTNENDAPHQDQTNRKNGSGPFVGYKPIAGTTSPFDPKDSPYFWHIYAYYAQSVPGTTPGKPGSGAGEHWWPDGSDNSFRDWFTSGRNVAGLSFPGFVKQTCFLPQRNRWYCYELMVKCNTKPDPSQPHDGEVQVWIDGVSMGHFTGLFFSGINMATAPAHAGQRMYITEANFHLHHTRAQPTDTIKWMDNIIIATDYIGPIAH